MVIISGLRGRVIEFFLTLFLKLHKFMETNVEVYSNLSEKFNKLLEVPMDKFLKTWLGVLSKKSLRVEQVDGVICTLLCFTLQSQLV